MSTRSSIERVLGAPLPADARNLHYARVQPSPDLSYQTTFAKFDASPESFAELMRRSRMEPSDAGAGLARLPAAWRWPHAPRWWDAGPATPPEAAARETGFHGWVAAKYEGGHVYVLFTDTGFAGDG